MCTSVVTGRDSSEALLSRCVPNLELDCLALEVQCADLEVHSDSRDVSWRASGSVSSVSAVRKISVCSQSV